MLAGCCLIRGLLSALSCACDHCGLAKLTLCIRLRWGHQLDGPGQFGCSFGLVEKVLVNIRILLWKVQMFSFQFSGRVLLGMGGIRNKNVR